MLARIAHPIQAVPEACVPLHSRMDSLRAFTAPVTTAQHRLARFHVPQILTAPIRPTRNAVEPDMPAVRVRMAQPALAGVLREMADHLPPTASIQPTADRHPQLAMSRSRSKILPDLLVPNSSRSEIRWTLRVFRGNTIPAILHATPSRCFLQPATDTAQHLTVRRAGRIQTATPLEARVYRISPLTLRSGRPDRTAQMQPVEEKTNFLVMPLLLQAGAATITPLPVLWTINALALAVA